MFKSQLYSEEEQLGTMKEKNNLNWFGGKGVFSGEILEINSSEKKQKAWERLRGKRRSLFLWPNE